MGLFSNISLIKRLQTISLLGEAKVSPAECANAMLNTSDAVKNLPAEKAQAIRALFLKYQNEQKQKILMDFDKFIETTANIYKEFDKIAPLENYVDMNDFKTKLCVAMARDDQEAAAELNRELLETIYGIR